MTKIIENATNQNETIKLQEKLVSRPTRKDVSVRKVFEDYIEKRFCRIMSQGLIKDENIQLFGDYLLKVINNYESSNN